MTLPKIRQSLARLRYHIRRQPWIAWCVYMAPNLMWAVVDPFLRSRNDQASERDAATMGKLALCLRFRDEARYLEEWIEYYKAAGADHFFLYNNYSSDDYLCVLKPYRDQGLITLIDWPRTPASPSAENNCIRRTRGRFDWVGFIDADEFVVIQNGLSVPDFLDGYSCAPAVALHWYYFGSSGHEHRPRDWVIRAYRLRASCPNQHFKVFVRPDQVTRNRNSHNFYYRRARSAVRTDKRSVFGSMGPVGIADMAWINHYFFKSLEDYLEKASRQSTLDKSGMQEPSRQLEFAKNEMIKSNDIVDLSAIIYFEMRQAAQKFQSALR